MKLTRTQKLELEYELALLDWIAILARAIESRPTSWGQDPVIEWRNASDEVCGALMQALEAKGLVLSLKEKVGYQEKS